MKNILFGLCLFLTQHTVFSQIETHSNFANQMDAVFAPLDKTKVPHGILLDFGMDFTNVTAFNGTLTDSTYATLTRLKQIYSTLLSSRIRNVNAGFVTPQQFSSQIEANRSASAIAITGLFFKYAQFNPNAISNNKIRYSKGKLYDKYISGFWQNPYQHKKTFAMAPAIKFYKGLNLTIKIPSSTFYSNYGNQIQSIKIDFNNGQGFVNVPFDQNMEVQTNTYR